MIEHRPRVGIVAGQFLGGLENIAAVRACLVIGEDHSRRLKLVVNLRNYHDVSVPGEHRRGATDGAGDLENLRVKDHPRILPRRHRTQDHGTHGAVRSGQLNHFLFMNDHFLFFSGCRPSRAQGESTIESSEPTGGSDLRPAPSELRNYWLWYIGSAVWLFDAALALHFDRRMHALGAIAVALLFLLAGAAWRRRLNRLQ